MSSYEIPGHNRFVRYYGEQKKKADGLPKPDAFCWRPMERYLSGNWIELHDPLSIDQSLEQIRDSCKAPKPGAKGRYAVLTIDQIRRAFADVSTGPISFKWLPLSGNVSHAGIDTFGNIGLLVRTALANAVTPDDVHSGIAVDDES